jgi:hypothetical protein
MELEGNLTFVGRKSARRLISALAVSLPVLGCAAGVTWFIRQYVSPPTIIPSPEHLVAPPPPVQVDLPVEASAKEASISGASPTTQSSSAIRAAAPVISDPPPPRTTRRSGRTETEPATVGGPIPQPRSRLTTIGTPAVVPLPRPRPREETGARDQLEITAAPIRASASVHISQPAHERHGAE